MTTTAEPVVEEPTRAVPVAAGVARVDLMPRVEVARRERESLTRRWVWAAVAAIVVTVLMIAAAFAVKVVADQRLVAEQARTNELLLQLSALSEVSQAIAAQDQLTQFRAEAMAGDFAWEPVFATVTGALPAGVTLTGFDLISGGATQGDTPTSEEGLVGTFTLDSPNPVDIVSVVRTLRGKSGVLAADGGAVTQSTVIEGHFSYEVTIAFDQTIYSDAYATGEGTR